MVLDHHQQQETGKKWSFIWFALLSGGAAGFPPPCKAELIFLRTSASVRVSGSQQWAEGPRKSLSLSGRLTPFSHLLSCWWMRRHQISFGELRDIYQFKCSWPQLFLLNRDGFDVIGEPHGHFYRLAIAYVAVRNLLQHLSHFRWNRKHLNVAVFIG